MGDGLKALLDNPLLSLTVVVLVIVGGVKSIMGDIDYTDLVTTLGPMVGLTAIARGIHENGKARAGR